MDNSIMLRSVTGVSLAATFTNDVVSQFYAMRYLILLCIVLIIVDYRWGIKRARKQNEEIRRSKAWRRTVNKFCDYICWLLLAGTLALAFSTPIADIFSCRAQLVAEIISIGTMSIAIGCELESIYKNWKIYRGFEGKKFLEILKIFTVSLVRRENKNVGDALNDALDNEENTNTNKKGEKAE